MNKLAIITTHPIQYNAPWFRLLAERKNCELKVFYTWSQSKESVKDNTFGMDIKWDIPLLDDYSYEFVENISKNPGSHHFFGINCPTLISKIKVFEPDAILFFGWKFKSHLTAIHFFKGKIPIWFRGDSTLLDELPGFKSMVRRMTLKKVYTFIDKAFYVGKENKAYFLKHNLKEHQLIYAPHAIDNNRFNDDEFKKYEQKAKQWREELGFKDEDIVIIFAGKFEIKKQPILLINAFIEANKKRQSPLKLVMIGSGPLQPEINIKINGQGHIHLLPFQNQTKMPIIYRLGNIFCLPSKGPGETWGLAVNESMASSRPVIVTDKVGGMRDMLIEGYNGYCFHHSNQQELTTILENLNSKKLEEMGENAKSHVEKFTMLKIVQALENTMP